jgi:hypothetical protein
MIYRTFQLFIEHRETGSFWVAILDGNVRKEHPDALEAIIRTGVCEDKGTASLIAKDCGYDFKP